MDGRCSGAIVYRAMQGREDDGVGSSYYEIDYNDEFPFSIIQPGEQVAIVDFSLQKPGEFEKLLAITDNVIWIDHHKTAIEKHGNLNILGIRQDGVAACVLAWQYFFPDKDVPYVVELLGDYDIWAFEYGEKTSMLQAGIRLHNTSPESENWDTWLGASYRANDLIRDGETALLYRNNYYRDLVKRLSFFAEFEGYRIVACNAALVNSQLFDSIHGDYDLMMPFYFDGNQWTVSIYTKKNIDCSELAKKYGGGGHKKAAGFQCKTLPFSRVQKIS